MNGACLVGTMFTIHHSKESVATVTIYDTEDGQLFYQVKNSDSGWISVEEFLQASQDGEISFLIPFWFTDELRIGVVPGVLQTTASTDNIDVAC